MKNELVLLVENSITEMASKVENNSEHKTRPRKLLDTGWARIPNAFKFELELKGLNPQ